jgi:apolipoprotein D and lipocalin family protein
MTRILALAAAFALSASTAFAAAPEPRKPVDPARFYQGRWLEIARRPMFITDGCVAGATEYVRRADGAVAVVDSCRQGSPQGKLKTIKGEGKILDAGTDAKLRVRYNFLITWDYWVLDHADDYSWFISADPKLKNLWIYTRTPPSTAELAALVARAKGLGYDTDKLEFPDPLKTSEPGS